MELCISIAVTLFSLLLGVIGYIVKVKPKGKMPRGAMLAVIIFLLAGIAGVWDSLNKYYGAKQDKQEVIDTAHAGVKKILDNSDSNTDNLRRRGEENKQEIIDSLEAKLKTKDSLPKEKPWIDIYPDEGLPNPVIVKTNIPDSFTVLVGIKDDGGYATDFKIFSVFIFEKMGQLYWSKKSELFRSDESKYLVKSQKGIRFTYGLKWHFSDTVFLYFNISFKDEVGRNCKPIHRIYRFTDSKFGETIPNASPSEYYRIKKLLITRKVWD